MAFAPHQVGIYKTEASDKLLGTLSLAGPSARLNKKAIKEKIAIMKVAAKRIQEAWNLWASINANDTDDV